MKPTLRITLTALSAAIIAVLTVIPLPFAMLGVPMTLQTFAVAFCGFLLGWKLGLGAVGLYLFLGAVGLPVFSGMRGGIQQFVGPTGGFLYGFFLLVLFCGLGETIFRTRWKNAPRRRADAFLRIGGRVLFGIAGLLLCHLCGVLQLSALNGISLATAIRGASLPFLPKDVASIVAACLLARPIRNRLPFLEG